MDLHLKDPRSCRVGLALPTARTAPSMDLLEPCQLVSIVLREEPNGAAAAGAGDGAGHLVDAVHGWRVRRPAARSSQEPRRCAAGHPARPRGRVVGQGRSTTRLDVAGGPPIPPLGGAGGRHLVRPSPGFCFWSPFRIIPLNGALGLVGRIHCSAGPDWPVGAILWLCGGPSGL